MSLIDTKYPNLELMAYMFREQLIKNEEWMQEWNHLKEERKFLRVNLECMVFTQVWGSTCTAFDVMPDGSAAIGGCAMTKAYTVVFRELNTEVYCVFVDDRPCYMVTDPTEKFYEDLKNHNMKSLSEARKFY